MGVLQIPVKSVDQSVGSICDIKTADSRIDVTIDKTTRTVQYQSMVIPDVVPGKCHG